MDLFTKEELEEIETKIDEIRKNELDLQKNESSESTDQNIQQAPQKSPITF